MCLVITQHILDGQMGSHGRKKEKQSVLSNKDQTFAAACNKDPLSI
jgi:hypothetical protein